MHDFDFEYYSRRMKQEQNAASAAANPAAVAAHRKLAEEYAALIAGVPVRRAAG